MNRGAAAAEGGIFRGDESRRRRGRDADMPRRRVAATPRRRRNVDCPRRRDAAAATRICRGDDCVRNSVETITPRYGELLDFRHSGGTQLDGAPWAALVEVFRSDDAAGGRPAFAFRNMMGDAYSIESETVPRRWLENGGAEGHAVADGDRFWIKDVELHTRAGVALYKLTEAEAADVRRRLAELNDEPL